MFTILIILVVILIIGSVLANVLEEMSIFYITFGFTIFIAMSLLIVFGILDATNTPQEIATPAKYTNQSYYIDNTKHLYIQQNDTTKPFGGDISSKIEYKDSAKTPSIQFKTIQKSDDYDNWIPFKRTVKTNTSISKVILPKSALTGDLTKVKVMNSIQSDSDDLDLVD